ncbi:hypothetical protein MKW94_025640 [Papaver nudicaule]|uniref:Uncharacterized protein n=1 Tax=Papaver nudicaule TaxID=74823 RepID=A0AA41V6T7_PAPNU|nr:hypothetical protein [Papaver nudicaule]
MKEDRIVVERVITVEYLQSSMATNLLCKFPDNSAFDFDYSQSGIWSPLLHRGGGPIKLKTSISVDSSSDDMRKKLLDDVEEEEEEENLLNGKENRINICSNVTGKMKNKIGVKMMKMMKKKMKSNKSSSSSLDLSITPMAKKGFTPRKGWEKVLRAASKQFKKQKCLPISTLQMKLPKFLKN